MSTDRISRRRFVGVAAGAAGAAALGPFSPGVAAARGGHGHGEDDDHGDDGFGNGLVPRDRISVQQWSIRDAITRLDGSVQGYLGGKNFPYDPTDLGPLTPLPGGFASVFRYLARWATAASSSSASARAPTAPSLTRRSRPRSTAPGWSPPAPTRAGCSR